jgi:transcriptional regulator GlxA family with amidase domain
MAKKTIGRGKYDSRPMIDVTVVLLKSGLASTAVGPAEVFHCAGTFWNTLVGSPTDAAFRVRAVSVDRGPIHSLSPLILAPDQTIADINKTDLIFIQTGGLDVDAMLEHHSSLVPWIQKQYAAGASIAAVCTGVAFPAAAGLLDGARATTHWAAAGEYAARFPRVDWHPEYVVTEDGRMFCGGGVNSATDLALYLVEKFCGHRTALNAAKALLIDMPRIYQSGYALVPLSPQHGDERIRRAEYYLQQNYADPLRVDDLATLVGLTPRTFGRRFRSSTGQLPSAYLQKIRIAAARERLENEQTPIQEIAHGVGYADLAHFRTLFRTTTGMSPAEYRSRFGLRANPLTADADARPARGTRSLSSAT